MSVKRVNVVMGERFRGLVAEYRGDRGISMPLAYRQLIEAGLIAQGYSLENLNKRTVDEEDIKESLIEEQAIQED